MFARTESASTAEPVKPPAAVDSPAPEGSPVSDALQTILQRDESEDARELAFLVSTGHCPSNVTLTEVDDGDLPALAELEEHPHHTFGLMMDYGCLPQKPFASDEEKQRFKRGLQNINKYAAGSNSGL